MHDDPALGASKLIRYGARLIAYAIRFDRGPADFPRRP